MWIYQRVVVNVGVLLFCMMHFQEFGRIFACLCFYYVCLVLHWVVVGHFFLTECSFCLFDCQHLLDCLLECYFDFVLTDTSKYVLLCCCACGFLRRELCTNDAKKKEKQRELFLRELNARTAPLPNEKHVREKKEGENVNQK
jgi:hypothetical protein